MALQTFTSGQVLTAAQVTALQTNDFNQTVSTKTASYTLVAADKGTRVVMNSASATTITVNTSLFDAGDTLSIHNIGAGVVTITAGTATVSTAGSLALAQNAGGTLFFTSTGVSIFFPSAAGSAAGIDLISTTSFSGVASTSLPASTFTSTYKNYRVILQATTASSVKLQMRMRAFGSDNTTADHNTNNFIGAGGSNEQLSAATSFTIGFLATTQRFFVFDILQPQIAANTVILANGYQDNSILLSSCIKTDTGQYDSATFFGASGNISGAYSVYGYNF